MQMNLKAKIQDYLDNTGATVASLERKVGLERAAIYNILRGSSKNPSITTVIKIAEALNCSLDELLDRARTKHSATDKDYEYNNVLFQECCDFITNYFSKNKNNKVKFAEVQRYVDELYSYIMENNIESIDQRFANWLLKSYFEEKK